MIAGAIISKPKRMLGSCEHRVKSSTVRFKPREDAGVDQRKLTPTIKAASDSALIRYHYDVIPDPSGTNDGLGRTVYETYILQAVEVINLVDDDAVTIQK
jgi:hypothetical protein